MRKLLKAVASTFALLVRLAKRVSAPGAGPKLVVG